MMKKSILLALFWALAWLILPGFNLAQTTTGAIRVDTSQISASTQSYPFSEDIARFESLDRVQPPPQNAILFIGSSSIRMWQSLAQDMAPLAVINRGFGGSQAEHAVHYIDRIVLPYRPYAIVFYEGDNDITAGVTPEQFLTHCRRFAEIVRQAMPACRIYFLSIKPSFSRLQVWPQMQAANALLKEFCQTDAHLTFIDISSAMLEPDGQLKTDIFLPDNLHLNERGYQIWTRIVRQRLIADLKSEL